VEQPPGSGEYVYHTHECYFWSFLVSRSLNDWGDTLARWQEWIVRKAVGKLKTSGSSDVDEYIRIINEVHNEWKRTTLGEYKVAMLLGVDTVPSWVLPRSYLGVRVELASFSQVQRLVGSTKLLEDYSWKKKDFRQLDVKRAPFALVTVNARDVEDALDRAAQPFELCRAVINWVGGKRLLWQMGDVSLAHVQAPPLYVSLGPGGEVRTATDRFVDTIERKTLETQMKGWMDYVQPLIRNKPTNDSSAYILVRALLSYGSAVDNLRPKDQFLGLWQVLEILSQAKNGSTGDVAKRVANLWTNGLETMQPKIEALAPVRNQLVHLGEFDYEHQTPIFLLNGIVCNAVHRFASLAKRFKVAADIDMLVSAMTQSTEDLKRRARISKAVIDMRAQD
jgi:hypothetical protein